MSLYYGDCMDAFKNMPDNCVTMTLADIPYSALNSMKGTKRENYRGALRKHSKGEADEINFTLTDFVKESVRVTAGSIYIFCSTEQVSEIRSLIINEGLSTRLCIWEKTNPAPSNGEHLWLSGIECCVFARKSKATFNEHCNNTVWRFPSDRSSDHPTPKPVKLMEYLIKTSSNEGDLIFDPCMGSGSTGVAAMKVGRRFLGIEKNKQWFDASMERICKSIEQKEMFA